MRTKKQSKRSSTPAHGHMSIPHELIAKRAYEIWVEKGRPNDSGKEAWNEAQAELEREFLANHKSGRENARRKARTPASPSRTAEEPEDKFSESQEEFIDSLAQQVNEGNEDLREEALAKLTWVGGRRALALVIRALNDTSLRVRKLASDYFFATYRDFPFPPDLPETLKSSDSQVRLEGIRKIVTVLPEARDAIAASDPEWGPLKQLTSTPAARHSGTPAAQNKAAQLAGTEAHSATEEARMERARSGKKERVAKVAESSHSDAKAVVETPHACLIRIPSREAMNRAVMVLGEVRVPYCGFGDFQLLVTADHIHVLEEERIPFEEVA